MHAGSLDAGYENSIYLSVFHMYQDTDTYDMQQYQVPDIQKGEQSDTDSGHSFSPPLYRISPCNIGHSG